MPTNTSSRSARSRHYGPLSHRNSTTKKDIATISEQVGYVSFNDFLCPPPSPPRFLSNFLPASIQRYLPSSMLAPAPNSSSSSGSATSPAYSKGLRGGKKGGDEEEGNIRGRGLEGESEIDEGYEGGNAKEDDDGGKDERSDEEDDDGEEDELSDEEEKEEKGESGKNEGSDMDEKDAEAKREAEHQSLSMLLSFVAQDGSIGV